MALVSLYQVASSSLEFIAAATDMKFSSNRCQQLSIVCYTLLQSWQVGCGWPFSAVGVASFVATVVVATAIATATSIASSTDTAMVTIACHRVNGGLQFRSALQQIEPRLEAQELR